MKKLLFTLGTVAAVAIPVIAVVSCSSDKKLAIIDISAFSQKVNPNHPPTQEEVDEIVKNLNAHKGERVTIKFDDKTWQVTLPNKEMTENDFETVTEYYQHH